MVDDADWFVQQVLVPQANNFQFQVDGIPFQAGYAVDDEGIKLHIWATLGYMPFSIESSDRRRVLVALLDGLRYGREAQFGINKENQIVVMQATTLTSVQFPEFIFVPLVAFLQKNLPFIRLIGECL
jgi:hypothetical protein